MQPEWTASLKQRLDVFLKQTVTMHALPRLFYVWVRVSRTHPCGWRAPAHGGGGAVQRKSTAELAQEQGGAYARALQQQIAECEDREMQYIERHNRVQVP